MTDPQSVLRTVCRVIEAELKPEAVVVLVRLNGENYMQPAGNPIQWPVLVLGAASEAARMLAMDLEKTDKKEEQK